MSSSAGFHGDQWVAGMLFLLLPQKAGRYLPKVLLKNRVFNLVIVVLQVLLYLAIGSSIAQPAENTGYGKGAAILFVAFFSSAVSLVIFFYSYLGFFRKDVPESRILRSIQFILTLPIIAFAFNISLQQRQADIRYREQVELRQQLRARKDTEQKKLRKINSERIQPQQHMRYVHWSGKMRWHL